ncbi:MAG: hypothetical protein K9M08_05290 [Pirellula sp.]|nr:hypothetical protein [Pirellula sp.]
MNVEVRNEAHLDIAEGVAFYDRQGYGAGDYFKWSRSSTAGHVPPISMRCSNNANVDEPSDAPKSPLGREFES